MQKHIETTCHYLLNYLNFTNGKSILLNTVSWMNKDILIICVVIYFYFFIITKKKKKKNFAAKYVPLWITLLVEVSEQEMFDNNKLSNIPCSKTSTSRAIQIGIDLARNSLFWVIIKIYHSAWYLEIFEQGFRCWDSKII